MKLLQEFLKWFKSKLGKDKFKPEERKIAVIETGKEPSKVDDSTLKKETAPKAITRKKDKIHVQAGLDFGTSSTKIAYSQLGGRGRKVTPLLFNHNLPHYPPYCLPSLAAFDYKGKLLLGIEAARLLAEQPWDSGLRRFKVIVAGKYDKSFDDQVTMPSYKKYLALNSVDHSLCKPECLTAVFLAFAMRQARREIEWRFPECEIDIAFNTCIPIDHIQNNIIRDIFEQIFAAAESIEKEWPDDNNSNRLLEIAKEKHKKLRYSPSDPDTRLFGVPEAVAEIASYLVSLQVRNGLHAVIDFGAGTTDFSIFYLENVRTRDEEKFWYAARNFPRGAQQIERIVSKYLENVTDIHVARAITNINNLSHEVKYEIKQELRELWEKSHAVWRQAYGHRKSQSEWEKDKVHVLVCGGGSKAPFIKEIFSKAWMNDWGPYPIYPLPVPDDYDSLDGKAPFERMSVAYGLCQPLPSLGKYILPSDVLDQTPPKLPVREMPEWDDRRPGPGWLG